MDRVPIRELQQHASAVLRRVRAGETLGVTDRGTLVAILAPPGAVGGRAALTAAGRVRPATKAVGDIPAPESSELAIATVLEELRNER